MSIGKLLDNRGFAEVLGTYRLLPDVVLLPTALFVSLGELLLGLCLAAGVRLNTCAAVVLGINTGYLFLAIGTLLRGLPIANCGCFGVFLARPLTIWTVVEDGFLVAASLAFFFLQRGHYAKSHSKDPSAQSLASR